MAVTLNASTSSGLVQTADTSGEIQLQSNGTTELTVTSTGVTVADNLLFNSGYGSAAVAYGCRAWVNFNGTGTVAIRASGNVTSITDNGVGDYTINFTNAMPDANYAALATANQNAAGNPSGISVGYPDNSSTILYSTTQVRFLVKFGGGSSQLDPQNFSAAIFR